MSNPNAPGGHPAYLYLLHRYGRPPNSPMLIFMRKCERTGAPLEVVPLPTITVIGLVAANEPG